MRQAKSTGSSTRRMPSRGHTRVLVAFLVVVLLVAFALENSQRVTVDYLYGTRDSLLVYLIFGSALLGALVDRLLVRPRR